MRIAVIGGAGVVGRHAVEALRRAGHSRISRIRGQIISVSAS
jgi:nucleoside-diphosphate-sugar epimerase